MEIPAAEHYLPQPDSGKTHHAFIVFGDDHLPVYISVTRKEWQVKPYVEAKKAEEKKKAAEDKVNETKDGKRKIPEIKIEGKIQDQMGGRGWTEKDIRDTVTKGPKGKSVDQRRPKNTDDGLGRNDPATVYGESGKYVVVNDRTGEVAQVSDKKDPEWVDDSRIQWEKK